MFAKAGQARVLPSAQQRQLRVWRDPSSGKRVLARPAPPRPLGAPKAGWGPPGESAALRPGLYVWSAWGPPSSQTRLPASMMNRVTRKCTLASGAGRPSAPRAASPPPQVPRPTASMRPRPTGRDPPPSPHRKEKRSRRAAAGSRGSSGGSSCPAPPPAERAQLRAGGGACRVRRRKLKRRRRRRDRGCLEAGERLPRPRKPYTAPQEPTPRPWEAHAPPPGSARSAPSSGKSVSRLSDCRSGASAPRGRSGGALLGPRRYGSTPPTPAPPGA